MRTIQKIISIFSALIILICSIAQFHHHDETGRMVVFCCSSDLCHSAHNHKSTHDIANNNICSHGCNDGNHQDEKNCSLKINIAKVEKKSFSPIIFFCKIFDNTIKNISQIENILYIPQNEFYLLKISKQTHSLRAPPIV